MARMIPDIDPETIVNNPGERDMYIALRDQLPAEWVVRYHLPACFLDGLQLTECEADFIVVIPKQGLIFVEVKSSEGFECEKGQWFRIDRAGARYPLRKNPFFQATHTKHAVVERIARKLGNRKEEFPGLYGHCVAYPRAKIVGRLCPSQEPQIILTYRDMAHIKDKLDETIRLWGPAAKAASFTPQVQAAVVDILKDECQLMPVLAASVDDDERVITDLTEQQWQGFRKLLASPKVTVRGTAGSGKTMLALWAAQALADRFEEADGKPGRVLFLCYNRILAKWLENKYAGNAAFRVRSYFSLCREYLSQSCGGFPVPNDSDEQHQFWTNQAPLDLARELHDADIGEKFDAVIVDEAQDFHKDWWFSIECLLKDPSQGHLYIFLDPRQEGVYGKNADYPTHGMAFVDLDENCRNTKSITRYCGQVVGSEIASFVGAPVGVVPEILSAIGDPGARAAVVRRLVNKFRSDGFTPERMAVLSPWRPSNSSSCLGKITAADGIPIALHEKNFEDWLGGKAIWGSTIKSFKGLEADCVVITDVPVIGTTGFSISDLYVAASRAKHRLVLIPSSKDAEQQLRSWIKT